MVWLACVAFVSLFFFGHAVQVQVSHKSKKYGTEVGVNAASFCGYTRICGMEGRLMS